MAQGVGRVSPIRCFHIPTLTQQHVPKEKMSMAGFRSRTEGPCCWPSGRFSSASTSDSRYDSDLVKRSGAMQQDSRREFSKKYEKNDGSLIGRLVGLKAAISVRNTQFHDVSMIFSILRSP